MGLAPLITAAAPIIGAGIQAIGQSATNRANAKQARDNRHWQRKMSNTAYQRAMKDMGKAGLNPILAYQKGGASSPGGAQAVMHNPMASATGAASSAASLYLQQQQVKAQTENLGSMTQLNAEKISTERSMQAQAGSVAALNNERLNTQFQLTTTQENVIKNMIVDRQIKFSNLTVAQRDAWESIVQDAANRSALGQLAIKMRTIGAGAGSVARAIKSGLTKGKSR